MSAYTVSSYDSLKIIRQKSKSIYLDLDTSKRGLFSQVADVTRALRRNSFSDMENSFAKARMKTEQRELAGQEWTESLPKNSDSAGRIYMESSL